MFSKLKLQVEVEDYSGAVIARNPLTTSTYDLEDNQPQLDTITRVPLNSLANLNSYKIKVTPTSDYLDALFLSYGEYVDTRGHYLMLISVVREVSSGIYSEVSKKKWDTITDNQMCPDASLTYAVIGDTTDRVESTVEASSSEDLPIACGSISFPNNTPPSSGPMSLVICFACMMLLNFHRAKQW